MKALASFLLALGLWVAPAQAQDHGQHHADSTEASAAHAAESSAPMSSALLPNAPMSHNGSGTAWLPAASPMYGLQGAAGRWALMVHGDAFLRYTTQDAFGSGERGDAGFGVPNWIMGMAQRRVGGTGQLALRGMLSLDPLSEGGSGYPLLFQTGETYEGDPLIDRQHPHDLFTELSVTYGQAFGERAGAFIYAAYPGEPALGPVAFMHRPSARHNPNAPLGHHWQDATHITFGVVTAGLRYGPLKLDGSVFTGREPDEERYGFDRPRFDSYSVRLSAQPTDGLSLQASRGLLHSPEALDPALDMWRTTASATYHRPLGGAGFWASTLAWGFNDPAEQTAESEHQHAEADAHGGEGHHASAHALLLETDLQLGSQAFFSRAEWVQKTAGELGMEAFAVDLTFGVGALTLGTARTLLATDLLMFDLGVQGTLYRVPEDLRSAYGERPVSLGIYLRLSPPRMMHEM